jgi:uncharacterized protein DUF4157
MPEKATRTDVKIGDKRPDLSPPSLRRTGEIPPGLAGPLSPTMAPSDAVAMLVESGSGEGAAESRRAILGHIQRTYGNRYAALVVADLRAQESAKTQGALPEPLESATTAPHDKLEQEADQMAELTGNGGGSILPSAVAMRHGLGGPPAPLVPLRSSQSGIVQRKCACGGAAGMSGECEKCSKKQRLGLQTKLKVNEPGDIYEQEADRIADQVLATPADPAVSGAPPRIQRFSGQSNVQMDVAPASVDHALASPGRPLEPALQQDMEQRFGYDFSRVRVHTDTSAAESAHTVSARAYTVGGDIIFGRGQYVPGTSEGKRLLAHELTHVVQQSGGDDIPAGLNDVKRDSSFGGQQAASIADEGGKQIPTRPATASVVALQRDSDDDLADKSARDLNEYVAKNPSPYKHVIEAIHFWKARELDDNVAAAFTELQSLAQLEKFAATHEGRAMLDVLYNAMITGKVSPFERLQSDRILYAKWKWMPSEAYRTLQLRDPDVDLPIEQAIDLKASKIAEDLNADVAKNLYGDVIKKFNKLDSYIEDNVASHFIVLQSPDKLEKFAANNEGRAMLDVLYEALITGDVTDFERLQAERILDAKAKRIPPIPPKEYLAQLEQEKQYILPLRMQKTFRSDYAIFDATLQPNGKVKVRYDDEIHFWNSDMFKEDFKNLPPYRVASTGFELNPDELVWLKLYDQGEKLVPVPALALIDYANQAKRQSVSVGVTAFQVGLFLGFGGLGAFSGARVSALAAEVEAGQASVTALRVAKGLLWADRVAMALPVVSMVVNENRKWILDKLPHAGPVLLGVLDQANRITEYYGWAQMGIGGARYLKSKLGSALTEWRAEAATRKGLSSSEQKIVKGVDNEIETILDDLSKAETQVGLAAVKFVEEHPNVIKGKPGERDAKVGNHDIKEVREPRTGIIRCKYYSEPIDVPCPKGMGTAAVEPQRPAAAAPAEKAPVKPTAEAAAAARTAENEARLAEITHQRNLNDAKFQELDQKINAARERWKEASAKAVHAEGAEREALLEKAKRNNESMTKLQDERNALRIRNNALRAEELRLAPPPPKPQTWQEAEAALRKQFSGQKKRFILAGENRDVDCFTPDGIAREAKFGPQGLSQERVQKELDKDIELLKSRRVKAVEWHFYENVNGEAGPSGPLRDAINAAAATGLKIKIVRHY